MKYSSKKVPQKSTESNASCMIKRPGCPEPRARAVIVQSVFCKSKMFRMHFIFVHFVRGGLRTKIKCILKIQSKSENPQRSVAVRKFHAYERSGVRRIQKFSAYEIFWIYSILLVMNLVREAMNDYEGSIADEARLGLTEQLSIGAKQ